jgi:hypothetical protein
MDVPHFLFFSLEKLTESSNQLGTALLEFITDHQVTILDSNRKHNKLVFHFFSSTYYTICLESTTRFVPCYKSTVEVA